jgi:hypothetical protein
MATVTDEVERHLIDARNTLAKTVTTHLGSVDFMTIPRAAFDSALRNIDAAHEASGHTALLREIEVLRERLQNAVFALEYWEREQRVHTGLYGPSRWSEGPYGRGKEEIAKGNAALSRPLDEKE